MPNPDRQKLHELLEERFAQAVRKCFQPCPLIGPKWLKAYPKGRPADFQWVGGPKVAKAVGRQVWPVTNQILKTLDRRGIDAEFEITRSARINVHLRPEPDKKAAEKKKPKADGKGES